ncbi:MAG: DUF1592 domain-containing protein [Pirellulales bacterium]
MQSFRSLVAVAPRSAIFCGVVLGAALRGGWALSRADQPAVIVASTPVAAVDQLAAGPDVGTLAALYPQRIAPFVKKYCADCHSGKEAEAMVDLDKYKTGADLLKDRRTWRNVAAKIRNREMPPDDYDTQPTEREIEDVAGLVEGTLRAAICNGPVDPGRVTIRRLNRAEYNNTIRDLVGVDFHPADDFPSDDVGYGFDNIGDVLAMPPILLEKYLNASEKIMDKALVVDDPTKAPVTRILGKNLKRDEKSSGPGEDDAMVLFSNGEVHDTWKFPAAGTYQIVVQAYGDQAGPDPARFVLLADKDELKTFDVPNDRLTKRTYVLTKHFAEGSKKLTARFTNDFYEKNDKDPKKNGDRNLGIGWIEVRGPLEQDASKLPESHKKIMIASYPPFRLDELQTMQRRRGVGFGKNNDERRAAEESAKKRTEERTKAAKAILKNFANRAFRRPATEDEVARLVKLWESIVIGDKQPFERGIQVACSAVLISPHFLYRIELDPQPNDPNFVYKLNDFEVATRLSYFLWSTMPDDELFAVAARGELLKGDNLKKQTLRMMKDRRAQALVENFGGQWLQTRKLAGMNFDSRTFRSFSEPLRAAMEKETLLFFATLLVEDRSILEFLDAKFTFLNETLAKHYGIEGIQGDHFRRVDLSGDFDAVKRRGGLLGMAGILAITSNTTRTSPVQRGKWIMETLLGTPPPPAPPMVPELADDSAEKKGQLVGTLKQRMEQHRADPTCASCHKTMDALGFGLENFNAVGEWREKDGREPIDSRGVLPGGAKFNGPSELKGVLAGKKDLFCRCLTEKMLTYALGRGLEEYDECTVERIAKAVQADKYRFSTLIVEITSSEPFLQKRGAGVRP